jgi:hypothetical protein
MANGDTAFGGRFVSGGVKLGVNGVLGYTAIIAGVFFAGSLYNQVTQDHALLIKHDGIISDLQRHVAVIFDKVGGTQADLERKRTTETDP